uniref:Uncharacterized protein n=1 Tax=Oryza punctata TaxID=4537 RepID=A0A0E0MEX7_ORYPU
MDMDMAHYLMTEPTKNATTSAAKAWYRKLLAEKILNNLTGILSFCNMLPEPESSILKELRVNAASIQAKLSHDEKTEIVTDLLTVQLEKMKSKGKMPDKVRSIKFTGSQSECEILVSDSQSTPVQLLAGAKRPRAGEPIKDVTVKKVRNKGQAAASTNDADVVEAPANKQTVYTRCSPKVVHAACRLLSPVHLQTWSRLGLGNIADMTLDGLEQPELTSWLMDRTDPETMTIQIADNKKIAITPWKLLYIDNLYVSKPGLMVDRLHTPRIQLYTKDLVEKICQEDRFKDKNDKTVFGQLNFNGILASCYSHPDYDKDKEPRGDNAGTPFAEELVSAVHISFPSMFDTIGPHLSGLLDDQKKPILVALGEYDRQAKISASNISRIIRSVQTSHARVSDHIVSILRGTLPTHQTYKGAQSSTDKQSNRHDDPVRPPPILFDATHVAEPSQKASTPPNNDSAKDPAAMVVDPAWTGGSVLPTRQILGDLVISDDPQQAVQGLNGISSDGANKLPVQQTVSVGIQAQVIGDDSTNEFSHAELSMKLRWLQLPIFLKSSMMKTGFLRQTTGMVRGLPFLLFSWIFWKILHLRIQQKGDVGAMPESKSNPPPLRRTHRRTKRPARFRSTPKAGQGKPVDNSAATQIFDMVLSDPNRYGRFDPCLFMYSHTV